MASSNPQTKQKRFVFQDHEKYYFGCPHCNGLVTCLKTETNCRIFRHAIHKHNGQQINPHTRKEECDRLFQQKLVYGCAKPFQFCQAKPNETLNFTPLQKYAALMKEWNLEKTNFYIQTCDYI